MYCPDKVVSRIKFFLFSIRVFIPDRNSLPAFTRTFVKLLGFILFAISSAFKNSYFKASSNLCAKVVFPEPLAPAIIMTSL